jgi:hypothetical protein
MTLETRARSVLFRERTSRASRGEKVSAVPRTGSVSVVVGNGVTMPLQLTFVGVAGLRTASERSRHP